MNRIDRVSAILIQLQTKRIIKAQHIADRFNISLRTVYRDIRSLEEAGIPVIGEAGVGYSLMDGYRLPPVMFSKEEAIAFLTAEKLVEKLTDETNAAHFKSAMYKVRAVLRSTEKDLLETIDDQVTVLKGNRKTMLDNNYMELMLKAVAEKKVAKIQYFSQYKNELTTRLVEPVGIFHLDHYWHLIAYCTLRNDYRDFRFDRIKELTISESVQKQSHPALNEYLENRFRERKLQRVSIAVEKTILSHIGDQKYYVGYVDEMDHGKEVIMNFLTASIEGFARWFIVMADHARIIEPELVRHKLRQLVQNIAAKI